MNRFLGLHYSSHNLVKVFREYFLSTRVHLHRVNTFITALEVQCNCHEILHLLFKQPAGSDCPSQSEFFFLYLPFTAYQQFQSSPLSVMLCLKGLKYCEEFTMDPSSLFCEL